MGNEKKKNMLKYWDLIGEPAAAGRQNDEVVDEGGEVRKSEGILDQRAVGRALRPHGRAD